MKTTVLIIIALFATVAAVAQQVLDKWPEMVHFEVALSQISDASEEGNFEPVRCRAKELMEKATALLTSAAKGTSGETAKEVQQQTIELYETASNPDSKDSEIKVKLEKVQLAFKRLFGHTRSPNITYSGR